MARPKSENPKSEQVLVRFTEGGAEKLDQMRGDLSRAEFLRQLAIKEWMRKAR